MNTQDTSPLPTKCGSSKQKKPEVNSELLAKQFQFKLRTGTLAQGTTGTLIYARERGKS